jgi:hypothetical protein
MTEDKIIDKPKDELIQTDKKKDVDKSKETTKKPFVGISVDNSKEDVLKLDKDGMTLVFDPDPKRFLKLDDEIYSKLSRASKLQYQIAEEIYRHEKKLEEFPERDGTLEVIGRHGDASATAHLTVLGKDPRQHYTWQRHSSKEVWKRRGYKEATDEVETFRPKKSGRHIIEESDGEALVLLKTPIENYDKIQRESGDLSRKRASTVEQQAIEELKNSGNKAFKTDEIDGRNWSPARDG